MITIGCKQRFIGFFSLFSFIATCSASGHGYLGASAAASFARLSTTSPQISYFSGAIITDAYPLSNNQSSTGMFGINGGYEWTGANWFPAIAFGLGLYSNLIDYRFNGQVNEMVEGDGTNTLYNYSFNGNSRRLMAEIQLNWLLAQISPFVSFGVGAAWNRMNNYAEQAFNNTSYPPLPPFQTRTNNNTAYQAGAGVSTSFNFTQTKSDFPHERISVGYRYVNTGTSPFGSPIFLQHLLSSAVTENDVHFSYVMTLAPFLFIATIETLSLFYKKLKIDSSFIISLLIIINIVVLSVNFNVLKIRYIGKESWDDTKESIHDQWELVNMIPPDASVVASFYYLAPLSQRKDLYPFFKIYDTRYQNDHWSYKLPPNISYALIDIRDPWFLGKKFSSCPGTGE